MPELPDLTLYIEHLERRVVGQPLADVRIASPFVLRTVTPTTADLTGKRVLGCRRLAKQIVFALEDDYFMVIHLMISGRFQWRDKLAPVPKRIGLAAFDFPTGTLLFTEASKKKRASLKLVQGEGALQALNPGGLEVLTSDVSSFAERLRETNHTLKRALTDQKIFAGIGNAYSDEILQRAGFSPFKQVRSITDAEVAILYAACCAVLEEWVVRLRTQTGDKFPAKVTAFHPEMAVHGKYKEPCPDCGKPVQRIQYAENEANYCAQCQTGGKLLADRSLSRLLKDNWPKRIEDLE